jgi:hypothetical protein
LESSNLALRIEVGELTSRVATIESENISLKKQRNEIKEQDALHHPLVTPNTQNFLILKINRRRTDLSRTLLNMK